MAIMTRSNLSIAGLMGVVLLIALGFAALRSPTIDWASGVFTIAVAFLATAVVAAIARRDRARAAWSGVAVFGWAYFAVTFGPVPNGNGVSGPPLPTQALLELLRNARESADQALSRQYSAWIPLRPDTPPLAESLLNTPSNARWMFNTFGQPPPVSTPTLGFIDWQNQRRIAHSLGAIVTGLVGGLVGRVLSRRGATGASS